MSRKAVRGTFADFLARHSKAYDEQLLEHIRGSDPWLKIAGSPRSMVKKRVRREVEPLVAAIRKARRELRKNLTYSPKEA